MNKRPTMKDIAAKAGVHYTTVSLAFRNHPSIPERTRQRIRRIAEEIGYRPDPVLSSLIAYRRDLRVPQLRSVLAWATNHPTRSGWRSTRVFVEYFEGARERAQQLGYRLEEFWLREGGMSTARAGQILLARGIRGLILAPQPAAGTELALEWTRFAVVTIGFSLAAPRLSLVANHQFDSMLKLMREVAARDYQRPGLVLPREIDRRVNHSWLGGFLAAQAEWPATAHVPPFLPETFEEAAFRSWRAAHRPDCIVTPTREVERLLRAEGAIDPARLGLAFPSVTPDEPAFSGIDEKSRRIGAAAVDLLSGLLHRNETGLPGAPQRVLIEGTWQEGTTLRPARARWSVAAPADCRQKRAPSAPV
jgi:LacI family transcriptional regulator